MHCRNFVSLIHRASLRLSGPVNTPFQREGKEQETTNPPYHKACYKFTVVSVVDRYTYTCVRATDHQFTVFVIHLRFQRHDCQLIGHSRVNCRLASLKIHRHIAVLPGAERILGIVPDLSVSQALAIVTPEV